MPSYAGLHFIMSQKFQPKTSVELEQEYNNTDINHLLDDTFDINNSILADEPMELQQEEDYYNERFVEEFETIQEYINQ